MERYWVLKTREDRDRDSGSFIEHWPEFKKEHVIAIGWRIPPYPWSTLQELACYIKEEHYPELTSKAERRARIAARTVWRFIKDVSVGDEVLLCRGYPANMEGDVHIYGIAQVAGEYQNDESSDWFRLKRKAKIYAREKEVPKARLAETLEKGSLLKTLHEISRTSFERLREWLI